jgi:ATP-binding cassette subfamily F protein uup
MAKLTQDRERLHTRMAEQATDHQAVLALSAELDALAAELEQVETEWLAAAEVAEA